MSETLENLVAKGEKVVETQEQRVERLRREQEDERMRIKMKEYMLQRKAGLKQNIELMELEVKFRRLQNDFTEEGLRKFQLDEVIKEKGLDKVEKDITELDDKDSDTKE